MWSYPLTLTSLGCYMNPWVPISSSAPRKGLEIPSENWISQIQPVNHLSWFICPLCPPVSHHSHLCQLSSFHIPPSLHDQAMQLHFACLNPISLFCFWSQIPYFSFYKFPLEVHWEAFPPVAGIPWNFYFPCAIISALLLWFTVLFLFFPILILDNFCSPVENIHAAPLWSSELFSQSLFAPQHMNLFSLQNKISEAFGWLWIFCCSASPKAGSWNKVCTVKV